MLLRFLYSLSYPLLVLSLSGIPTTAQALVSSSLVCGQDLDNNGYAGDPGEAANCVLTPQGTLCPVGSAECVEEYSAPLCPEGTSLEPTRDMCQAAPRTLCGSGYSWDPAIGSCTGIVSCPENGTFNPLLDRCEKLLASDCPAGYALDTDPASATYDLCVQPVQCSDGGVFTAERDRCEKIWQPVCDTANGYAFNPVSGTCAGPPTCPYGDYHPAYDLCLQPIATSCPDGYSLVGSRNRCEKAPECPPGSSYNVVTNTCEAIAGASLNQVLACSPTSFRCTPESSACCSISISCPEGPTGPVVVDTDYCCFGEETLLYRSAAAFLSWQELGTTGTARSAIQCDPDGVCSYYSMERQCRDGSPQTPWTRAGSLSMSALQPVCPVGQVLVNGSQCLSATNPVCSGGGSFDGELDFCWTALAPVCDQGSYDSIAGLCVLAPSCPGGTLNRTTDLCEAAAADGCGSYAFDAALGLCYSPPVCDSGAYDPVTNTCIASLARDCGSYVWSRDELTCLQGVTCPQDPAFPAAAAYSENLDVCLSAAQHDCPAGTSYTPLPVGSCEAVPVCSGDGIYKPETDGCFEGLNLCPLGKEYACMEQGGDMVCSPNPCFDPAAPGAEVTSTLDQSMLQDDGPRDSEGRCLAQLFIFNGKASRCRPPGMTVGLLNDCCESDQVAAEDMGGSLQNAAQGIQIAYEIGQVAYYGNALATGAAQISAISTGTAGAVTSMTVVTAGGTTTTLSGAAATGAYATMASGTTGASALSAGLQAYAGALLNPATIAVAVAVAVVMKMLMGSGCDQGDIQAGMQEAARDCHYVGDYCEKKWPLVGCVQKARSYCCFNSKMARIIQEQGRPQLLAFQPGGAWGAPEQANCRGFTPDEFQVLDFSHIDLSEYFADVQKDLVTRIQGSQETIRQNIESRYQAMPK